MVHFSETYNLSHPRFGQPVRDADKTKVHLQGRISGRDFLTMLCWNEIACRWSWHFYNERMDRGFQKLPSEERQHILKKVLREYHGQELESLKQHLQGRAPQLALPLVESKNSEVVWESSGEEQDSSGTRTQNSETRPELQAPTFEGHNLIAYFEELNAAYFGNAVSVPVIWTRKSTRDYRYGITFGLYDQEKREIRMNARLNQEWVPDFFVKMVLHHEMLHVVVPPLVKDGRTLFHHREFRKLERAFIDFKKAVLWQRANLKKLMKFSAR